MKSLIVGSMLGCLVATQLWASEPVAPVAPPAEVDWSLIATKAVTFEVMSSALETGIFMAFYGGSTALAGSLFLVSLTTAGVAYAAHEYAWESALPADADRADPDLIASKSVTYRVLSTARLRMRESTQRGTRREAHAKARAERHTQRHSLRNHFVITS